MIKKPRGRRSCATSGARPRERRRPAAFAGRNSLNGGTTPSLSSRLRREAAAIGATISMSSRHDSEICSSIADCSLAGNSNIIKKMSDTKLAKLVKREALKRLEKEIKLLGGMQETLKEHLSDNREDLEELFMFNVGEEFVQELEQLCNL